MSNSEVPSLLNCLEKCKTASVKVCSLVSDTAPDIAICNSDGYFIEIKGKKIVNSLNLNNEIGCDIKCFYLYKNKKPFIFYLVKTKTNKLLLIERLDSRVQIIKIYNEIKNYEVSDFISVGYPQLKIFKNSSEEIVKFPIFDTETVVDQLELETNSNSIAKLLAEKLQIVRRHVDELTEEWQNMKKIVQLKNCNENFSCIPVHFEEFSLPLEEYAEKITIKSTWIKMIADKIVLGINFFYDGEKEIPSLEFKMFGKLISDYSYRFFPHDESNLSFQNNPLFLKEKINSSILPGQTITVVGAASVNIHNSLFETELKITCYLASEKLKNYLARKTFDLNICNLLDIHNCIFNSLKVKCSVEDLQVIKTVKSETKFKIKIKGYAPQIFENLLKTNFNFEEVNYREDKLYYSRSKYLKESFVAIQPFAMTAQVWKFNFYTSNEAQIYFFINILHECLPENITILLDDD